MRGLRKLLTGQPTTPTPARPDDPADEAARLCEAIQSFSVEVRRFADDLQVRSTRGDDHA